MRAEAWSYYKKISAILGLLIYRGKYSTKKYLSKFMYDNWMDSIIVNWQKIDFCDSLRKLNSLTETDLEFIMLLKGNLPPKINSYGNIFSRTSLLYIFEFQLVLFAFSLFWEALFMSPPPSKVCFCMGHKFCGVNL